MSKEELVHTTFVYCENGTYKIGKYGAMRVLAHCSAAIISHAVSSLV